MNVANWNDFESNFYRFPYSQVEKPDGGTWMIPTYKILEAKPEYRAREIAEEHVKTLKTEISVSKKKLMGSLQLDK